MQTFGRKFGTSNRLLVAALSCASLVLLFSGVRGRSSERPEPTQVRSGESHEEAERQSAGCITCHSPMDEATMHPSKTVQLGCTDCHGGDPAAGVAPGSVKNSREYLAAKSKAHVAPRDSIFRDGGSLPERAYTKWL